MNQSYIYGIKVIVSDTEKAAKWLCENLFFESEKDGPEPVLSNHGFRLILKAGGSESAKDYDPDAQGIGLRHVALETYDINLAIEYCKSRGMTLQLGDRGGARYSGKVYGTGMDYFNIITDFGFNIEVSQKLHCRIEPEKNIISGLEHVGLQTSDAYRTVEFYEKLGFRREFEPVINHVDGHTIICCMVSSGGTTLEIYEFDDLPDIRKAEPQVLDSLIIAETGKQSETVCVLEGTAGEHIELCA